MKAKRAEFSDRVKADIFVRDRALCCYTGANMWLLDYGAAPSALPWIEHIKPASKGGSNRPDNGVLTNWMHNKARGNGRAPPFLYREGLPTDAALVLFDHPSDALHLHYVRFLAMHWSDWYVNLAVAGIMLAANQENAKRVDGKPWVRTRARRSARALRVINSWRAITKAEKVATLAHRGLSPLRPGPDHKLLLQALAAESEAEIDDIVLQLAPRARASWNAHKRLGALNDLADPLKEATKLAKEIANDPLIAGWTKRNLVEYLRRMAALHKRVS